MNKNKLYWYCQIGGWLFLTGIELIGYGNVFGFNQLLLVNGAVNFLMGLTLTHIYRLFLIKQGWLELPLAQLIPRAFICIAIISCLMVTLNIFLDRFTVPLLRQLPIDGRIIFNYLFSLSKYILLWALIYHLFQYWEKSLQAEKERYQLMATLKETQYNNLRTQLNPHFLFNSLNSIRTLVDVNPSISKEAITRLSNLLRSSLHMNRQRTVTLKDEVETVKDYLGIEKIRYDERLQYELHLSPDSLDMQIPPMMLQTLVENGVKHGISSLKGGGMISISSMKNDKGLHLEIINSGQYNPADEERGFGIENTRERLKLLYDDKAQLDIRNLDEKNVITKINIPV